jgi:beta-galactosidase
VKPALEGVKPVHEGEFARGAAVGRDVRAAGEGRQFCLESLDAFDGKQYAAVAELALLGVDGKPLNQSNWTIAYASSEEATKEDGGALNAINGEATDHWHTAYSGKAATAPGSKHRIASSSTSVATTWWPACATRRAKAPKASPAASRYRAYVGQQLAKG